MNTTKRIALVAHDHKKKILVEWVKYNWEKLIDHEMVCTGTTGRLLQEALEEVSGGKDFTLVRLKSGPLGGDQQLGAMIAEGKIDAFIFLWDPMSPQPHDVDVKALLRISVLYNIPTASNRSSADFLITSPLFKESYQPEQPNFDDYQQRTIS